MSAFRAQTTAARVRISVIMVAMLCACGSEQPRDDASEARFPQPHPTPPSQLPSAQAAAPTGAAYTVSMVRGDERHYAFEPANLVIRQGDRVQWIVKSGVPHNVSFYPDSIPSGAAVFLERALAGGARASRLGGPMLTREGQTFELWFARAPTGLYRYFCAAHGILGMHGTIIVEP